MCVVEGIAQVSAINKQSSKVRYRTLFSLLGSCVQDCVQEPIGAPVIFLLFVQGTSPLVVLSRCD